MEVIAENLPAYFSGFMMTLALSLVSGILALFFGTILAIARVSPIRSFRLFSTTYVELLGNTPLTLVFFFCVLVLPRLGVTFKEFAPGAIIALSLYTSAFVCEAVRSGINSVAVGQAEAARSIGLTFGQTATNVIIPQALRTVIPPLINVIIALVKNSSVAGGFYVNELFSVGRNLATENANNVIWVLLGVSIFYLLITVPLGLLANYAERKVTVDAR